jgi:hypothetical protein
MSGGRKPPHGPHEALDVQEHAAGPSDELRACWSRFRSGDPVPCPLDQAPLALAVDASAGAYRFVCTTCGASSAWFESGPSGIQLRAHPDDDHPK